METKICRLLVGAFLLARISGLNGQTAVTAAGGNASGTGGTISYSVGQIAYTTLTGSAGTVNQGVQIPFEISGATGQAELTGVEITCSAYPNPVIDLLKLTIKNSDLTGMTYQLLDIRGILLEDKKVIDSETAVSMKNLAPAVYFLKVTDKKGVLKTFRVIKNQPQ